MKLTIEDEDSDRLQQIVRRNAGADTLKKRWVLLLPAVFVTYSLAYLDRANYGFGAAAGMAATLRITGKENSLLGALFFLGYLAFQLPGAAFARKHGARWLVFTALIAWGALGALTGVLTRFWMLAVDRFLLGGDRRIASGLATALAVDALVQPLRTIESEYVSDSG